MAAEPNFVSFEIDGREVWAPEGMTLLDAARHYGDVEIPYFCYEAKLGQAVGACRMCTVEVEGMGLDISCSLTVEDGMVVSTTSPSVQRVQKAVVEFLLVNHPLDCPVCDKGGECPLQDISFGWGAGYSRFIEPKRHWKKPLELSPLIAIDRERCILCFRCTRFSQEVAEDYQLVFLERGDSTYVGTHDGRPYVAPFSGNVIELCPVGALTSNAYRFRARPWDVEDSGSVCTLCPSQCNVKFTIRDDNKVVRVSDRQNNDVDDGWLCDKGRFGFQAIHAPERISEPMVNEGGALRAVSWERAMSEAVAGLERAGSKAAALAGGQATNEEGFLLQRLMREALGSPHVDSRAGGPIDPEHARALARPDISAKVADIEAAGTVLVLGTDLVDEAPILDLRVRKAKRRNRVRVVVAGSHPGLLDPNADAIVRFGPGAEEAAIAALVRALAVAEPIEPPPPEVEPEDQAGPPDRRLLDEPFRGPEGGESGDDALADLARRAGTSAESVERAAGLLRGSGPVVVLWGERLSHGRRGRQATAALLALARALDLPGTEGAGMIEVPAATNARGLREVGCLPNLRPGLAGAADAPGALGAAAEGQSAGVIARALGHELEAVVLLGADPLRTHPDREAWRAGLERARFVLAFADFPGELTELADVVLPLESYAEQEGTITHPDGRVQRVRQAIPHLGEVRPTWSVLVELAARLGAPADPPLMTAPMVTAEVAAAVPFYRGLTLEEIGGRGVRWQEREAASAAPTAELPEEPPETPPELGPAEDGALRLGTVRSLWAHPAIDFSPILRFLAPLQRVELAGEDARALGIEPGDEVEVALDGTSVRGIAHLRDAVAPGAVFLVEGTTEHNATALTDGAPRTVRVSRVPAGERVLPEPERGEGPRATREVHAPRAGGQSGVEVSPA